VTTAEQSTFTAGGDGGAAGRWWRQSSRVLRHRTAAGWHLDGLFDVGE
jgi:hypothetical protein